MSTSSTSDRSKVPVRRIATAIAMVLATALLLLVLHAVSRVLVWIIVAVFFAVALYPVINWVEQWVTRGRRSLATLLVFVLVLFVLGGLITAFVVPLTREGVTFAGQLPQLLDDARAGRGPIGNFLDRTNALTYIQNNQDRVKAVASGLTTPAAGVLKGVATGVAGVVTIFVLAYLMVLEGPKVVAGSLNLLREEHRPRVRAVAADCAKSITGYLSGNLLISVICGVLTYVVLLLSGVPYAGLIALFVAVADLIPLVGATLGAIVAVVAAAIHSIPALIAVAIFFVVYQQLENHLLQPVILSRTVKAEPPDRTHLDPHRGRTGRYLGCFPGDTCGWDDPGHRARRLGPPPRPPEERANPSARTVYRQHSGAAGTGGRRYRVG